MQENRYSRHELLKEVGIEGQKRIAQGRVLIIGAGGLGSPASLYLASSGVKKITIVDSDMVDLTNLQRQVIHNMERLGLNKAESAKVALQAINPEVEIVPVDHRPSLEELEKLVSDCDVALDCTDNTESRYTFNDVCRRFKNRLSRPAWSRSMVKLPSSTLEIPSRPVMPVCSLITKERTRRLRRRAYLHP